MIRASEKGEDYDWNDWAHEESCHPSNNISFPERAGNLHVQLCSGSTLRVTFQPTGRLTNHSSPLTSLTPSTNHRRRRVYVSQSGSAK